MTAQTQSQRNASYRQRQREKIARYEGALRDIVDRAGNTSWDVLRDVARDALKL